MYSLKPNYRLPFFSDGTAILIIERTEKLKNSTISLATEFCQLRVKFDENDNIRQEDYENANIIVKALNHATEARLIDD